MSFNLGVQIGSETNQINDSLPNGLNPARVPF